MAIFNNKKKDEKSAETLSSIPAAPAAAAPAANAGAAEENTFDFNRYFLAPRPVTLENITYESSTVEPGVTQMRLGMKDSVAPVQVDGSRVKITYNRHVSFEPSGPFRISISYSCMLTYNPGTKDEIDWSTIDLGREFQKANPAIMQTVSSRASLLIAEITAANGQAPLILGGVPIVRQQPAQQAK